MIPEQETCRCGSKEPADNNGECEVCESTICFYCGEKVKISESKLIKSGKRICKEHKEE